MAYYTSVLYKYDARWSGLGTGFDDRSEGSAIVDEVRGNVVFWSLLMRKIIKALELSFRKGKTVYSSLASLRAH